jgi:hypothetical protein
MRKAVLSIIGFLALAGIIGYVATWGADPRTGRRAAVAWARPAEPRAKCRERSAATK